MRLRFVTTATVTTAAGLALWVVGCSKGGAPPDGGGAPAAPTPAPAAFRIAVPDPFERSASISEGVALDQVYHGLNRRLCEALVARSARKITGVFARGFHGQGLTPARGDGGRGVLRAVRRSPSGETLGYKDFARHLAALGEGFADVKRCTLKPFHFKLSADHRWAWAELKLLLEGRDGAGHRMLRRGTWSTELVQTSAGWRYRKIQLQPLEEVRNLGLGFSEVSTQVGVGLHRDEMTRRAVTQGTDAGHIETIGGVGVIDFNRDGLDDLLAWNKQRGMRLFLNDGAGGFRTVRDPIPPSDVGLFHLFVDLDGDGNEELLSTELVACARGVGTFPLFTRRGEGFVRSGALRFKTECGAHRATMYQHAALADVDRDGDLDLFIAGFGEQSTRGNFNKFDSNLGGTNLLFINEGGLKFTERGTALGLEGTRHSYAAAFFDYEDDGDWDLFIANDFGPNELFLNRGDGHFERGRDPALTENGQSMGVTVADLDGDERLDIYVSNMQSTAGSRIVPLHEGELQPDTYEALLMLARGNSLYLNKGGGHYEEAGVALGLNGANWAWGQALLDFDNDGLRDLYVANGLTSNSTLKDDDY